MKNNMILAAALCLTALMAKAQIPNAGFEKWESKTFNGKTVTEPFGWGTSNSVTRYMDNLEMIEKTTDAFEGEYAMKLTNKVNSAQMGAYALPLSPDQSYDRFPFTERMTTLTGHYKYDYTAAHDSFAILVMLFKNGVSIGYGNFISGVKKNTYTPFTISVQYFTEDMPDSASLGIFASADEFKEGTTLTIDDLKYTSQATGVAETLAEKMNLGVAPNPASGAIRIGFEQLQKGTAEIRIYDLLGNEAMPASVHSLEQGSQSIPADVSSLPAGIYLIRLKQGNTQKTIRLSKS